MAATEGFLQNLPVVGLAIGPVLAVRDERRHRRLEGALAALAARLSSMEGDVKISAERQEAVEDFIIEAWIDNAERARPGERRDLLVELAARAISSPEDFDEAKYFLSALSGLEDIDLHWFRRWAEASISNPVNAPYGGVPAAIYSGSLARLNNWGLMETQPNWGQSGSSGMAGTGGRSEPGVTDLGLRFYALFPNRKPTPLTERPETSAGGNSR